MAKQPVHPHAPRQHVGESRPAVAGERIRHTGAQRCSRERDETIGRRDDAEMRVGLDAVGHPDAPRLEPHGHCDLGVGDREHDNGGLEVRGAPGLPGEVLLEQAGDKLREAARVGTLEPHLCVAHGSINTLLAARRSNNV